MRQFKLTKKLAAKSSCALLAGAMFVVSGCQAKEVLNFYQVMTASSTFSNYEYMITMESPEFDSTATKTGVIKKGFDGIALKGIVTDGTSLSTGIQLKIDGQYKDVTQLVIRDDRIYIDCGSILNIIKELAPDSYEQVQKSIDEFKKGMDQQPDTYNQQLAPYGVTVDDIKDRLDKNIGWLYISMSTVDEAIDMAKESNEKFKEAISIDKVESLDEQKYPEAAKIIAQQIGQAVEKRFGGIEPSFTNISKDGNEYSFHLDNNNMEAFLDACAAFASEDLISIIDASVEVMQKEGITNGVDSIKTLKEKLLEKHETYDPEDWSKKIEKTSIEQVTDSLNNAKKSFGESKDKIDFDWLSTVSLTGGNGSRVWTSTHKVHIEPKETAKDEGKDPVGDMMSVVDYTPSTPQKVDMTVTISLKEFKDASAALGAMVDPGADAYCLDTAALSALEASKTSLSRYNDYSDYNYDDYGSYNY